MPNGLGPAILVMPTASKKVREDVNKVREGVNKCHL